MPGEVYNIGACEAHSVRELLETLLRLRHARTIEVRQDPQRLRPVDTPMIVGDCSKLRDARRAGSRRFRSSRRVHDVLDYWRGK